MDKLLDLTRDFDAAKAAFEAYLDEYDRADDKIHLKIVHTYGVVDAAEDIARRMGLDEEDVQLAKVIGLLHDIGRFEQIKRFDSFEPGTMEHAAYGAQLLFGPEKMIRRFVKDDRFDSLICTAIEKHSDFKLEGITDERTLLHAKLIRDADKLDNCRVKLEESMETLLGVDEKGVGEGVIAPKVWESCMAKESVLSSDRVSKVDYWISYIAQYYDINFPETYEIMREHDYVKNNYYCSNKNSCHPIADSPIVKNCRYGEIDQWKYDFKYKPNKSDKNVSKKLMYEELKKILFGIKLKDIDTIMKEINELQDKITSYREPYKCETCAVKECDVYALGCRDCSGWK